MGTFHVRYEGANGCREFESGNFLTDEGKRMFITLLLANDTFSNLSGTALGLIDAANFTAVSTTDTFDDIGQPGNDWEEFTDYQLNPIFANSTTSRIQYGNNSVVAGVASWGDGNSWLEFTASGTVRGMFIAKAKGNAVFKGNHDPYLNSPSLLTPSIWGITLFDTPLEVVTGARLYPSYTLGLTDA